jgi:hypothetical protein
MKGTGLLRLAWFLAALLFLSAVMFTLSDPDTTERPLGDSYLPGGTAAFAELLRRDGYQVETRSTIPFPSETDIIPIAFLDQRISYLTPQSASNARANSGSDSDESSSAESPENTAAAQQYLRSYLEAGHPAILLAYNEQVHLEAGTPTTTVAVSDVNHRTYTLTSPTAATVTPPPLFGTTAVFAPATMANGIAGQSIAVYNLNLIDGGVSAYIGSGDLAMNAYIDQRDNARFLVDAVHSVAPPGSKLVFLDPTVNGGGEPGILDVIGAWSKGALLQAFLVFAVIVFTLGKRFGIADEFRFREAGTRDLLEGISNTYTRARAGKAALATILESQDRRVRRFLKLPVDSPKRKRNDVLPSTLVNAFRQAEHLEIQDPTPDQALLAVRGLESEVNALLGPPRSTRSSRHRVKSR